jgi:hypothetical protein
VKNRQSVRAAFLHNLDPLKTLDLIVREAENNSERDAKGDSEQGLLTVVELIPSFASKAPFASHS